MDGTSHADPGGAAGGSSSGVQLQKPKSRLLTFRDRLLSPHLKEYRPHAAESLHQRQVQSHVTLLFIGALVSSYRAYMNRSKTITSQKIATTVADLYFLKQGAVISHKIHPSPLKLALPAARLGGQPSLPWSPL